MSGEVGPQTVGFWRRRWTLFVGPLLVVGLAVVGAALTVGGVRFFTFGIHSLVDGNPDPGGRVMKALSATEVAVPSDALVTQRQRVAPYWLSCPTPASSGWAGPSVEVVFTSHLSRQALLTFADTRLVAQGWKPSTPDASATDRSWTWTRTLDSGDSSVFLFQDGKSGGVPRWDLSAVAPPMTHRGACP